MTGFFDKLFRRRRSSKKTQKRQPPPSFPAPSILRPTGDEDFYDYVEYSPAVEKLERQYMYTHLKLNQARSELKKIEDDQINAVLEGRPTEMDTLCFHTSYEILRSHIRELESMRRSLRRRAIRARRDAAYVPARTTVHYPPL